MSGYNEELNAVFIHIPKNAGSSMEYGNFDGGHRTAMDMRRRIGETLWNNAFKFAFVRDPLDRFISGWCHKRLIHGEKALTFEQQFEKVSQWVRTQSKDSFSVRALRILDYCAPQSWFICDGEGNLLLDFVGRFHCLQADWNVVCDRLGLNHHLPHILKTEHLPYSSYYTPETQSAVSELYHEDYKYLGSYFPDQIL